MSRSKKARHLDEALALRREGLSPGQIAAALPVSASTVRRWLRAERQAPSPETERPEPDRTEPSAERLRRKLEERLERLIEESEVDQGNARLEDRMLKVCKVLEFLRGEGDDVAAQLEAMDGFSDFCVRTLSEGEMTPVRKAVRLFLDELKRKHS